MSVNGAHVIAQSTGLPWTKDVRSIETSGKVIFPPCSTLASVASKNSKLAEWDWRVTCVPCLGKHSLIRISFHLTLQDSYNNGGRNSFRSERNKKMKPFPSFHNVEKLTVGFI